MYNYYDISGSVTSTSLSDGSAVSYTADYVQGRYLVPSAITPNSNSSLSSSFTWASFLGLTQTTGPNGATLSVGYDAAARPSTTTSPTGATTTYTYNNAPGTEAQVVATSNGRWTRTTLDGLGRTVQSDTGTGSVTDANVVSRVLTVYGPCACTPIGKLQQISRPFNPNAVQTGEPFYTTYSYDPLGRTTQVTLPDASSHTTYAYSGNTVTVTDPGGRWKKYTSDAFGNVTQVNEPNPAGGADYVTQYAYNAFDKLTNVTMQRTMPGGNNVTQTRTFVYDVNQRLTSVTHPESGTTTYTYDTAGRVLTKTDAKNNLIAYSYDLYGRVTKIQRTPGTGTVEPEPTTTFLYDVPDSSISNNYDHYSIPWQEKLWGRLSKITHGYGTVEWLSYTSSGLLAKKCLANPKTSSEFYPACGQMGYDVEGRMTAFSVSGTWTADWNGSVYHLTQHYPQSWAWQYDALGRPSGLGTGGGSDYQFPLIQNATYSAAGQVTSYQRSTLVTYDTDSPPWISGTSGFETVSFQYNKLGQLTQQSGSLNAPTIQYSYSPTQNDGRIQSRYDASGALTTSYVYDSLGRLASAVSTPTGSGWGQSFVYDPFGNLLQQNVTSGSAPAMSLMVDPNTNRITTSGFVYDAAGNLTQSPAASGTNAFSYDSENRMVRAPDGAGTASYFYGASGELLFKARAGQTNPAFGKADGTFYFYGPDGVLLASLPYDSMSYDGGAPGAVTRVQPELRFAGRLVWFEGTKAYATIADRLGSVMQESRVDLTQRTSLSYFPYGQGTSSSITGMDPGFATYHQDGGSGLQYAMNRYYDPARGRFTTPDPSDRARLGAPLSWNRYSYTEGDPINFNDPNGLFESNPYGGTLGKPVPETSPWGGAYFWGSSNPHPGPMLGTDGSGSNGGESGLHVVGVTSLLADAIKRIQADLSKVDCAKDFKNASATSSKASTVGSSDQGQLQFITQDGTITAKDKTPGVARYNSFTGSIKLNTQVNWSDPSKTTALLDGSTWVADLLTGQAAALGIAAITGQQFMDLTILHELSHYNGALGDPDKNSNVEKDLWADCIK